MLEHGFSGGTASARTIFRKHDKGFDEHLQVRPEHVLSRLKQA